MTKFTKTAFRKALRENDQTEVWHLAAIKYGRTPTRKEVQCLVELVADTTSANHKAFPMAYTSLRKSNLREIMAKAWDRRGAYRQYDIHYYREKALKLLRELAVEPLNYHYTKVPMSGMTHLYFCSPHFGHADYNKVCTCPLNGPLVTDRRGKRYDPQAAWCSKVIELGNRIYSKKGGK